uniref:Uncharacterized protein n=1 Tax=Arundo donax TaxID=35708 RepID=A0A0A9GP96_ARUDO
MNTVARSSHSPQSNCRAQCSLCSAARSFILLIQAGCLCTPAPARLHGLAQPPAVVTRRSFI